MFHHINVEEGNKKRGQFNHTNVDVNIDNVFWEDKGYDEYDQYDNHDDHDYHGNHDTDTSGHMEGTYSRTLNKIHWTVISTKIK